MYVHVITGKVECYTIVRHAAVCKGLGIAVVMIG